MKRGANVSKAAGRPSEANLKRRSHGILGLDWVRTAIRRVAGFDPYPGTLNLRLAEVDALRWRQIRAEAGTRLAPPEPDACGGRLIPARIGERMRAAVVVPDITRYGDDLLEIIAPVHFRTHFGLRDGDLVRLTVTRSFRLDADRCTRGKLA